MKNLKIIIPVLIVVAILIIVFVSWGNRNENVVSENTVLRVGYLPLTDHLPLMVADGANLFEGVKVEPVKFTDWPSLVEALKSGKIDGAHIINSLAVKMVSDGFDGQAVVLSHRGDIGLSTHSHIVDVQELRGKTIAVPTRFSPHFMMLHNYLTQNGIDVDKDVKILDVAPPDFVSTMAAGGADAFIGSEPFPTLAESKEVGETFKLWDEMQIAGTNGLDCVVVFPSSLIENNPDAVQNYVDSIVKTGIYIEENPLLAAEAASTYMLNLDPKLIVKAIDEPRNRSSYDDLLPKKTEFEAFQNYMIKLGLIAAPIDLDFFVNDSFAKQAYK